MGGRPKGSLWTNDLCRVFWCLLRRWSVSVSFSVWHHILWRPCRERGTWSGERITWECPKKILGWGGGFKYFVFSPPKSSGKMIQFDEQAYFSDGLVQPPICDDYLPINSHKFWLKEGPEKSTAISKWFLVLTIPWNWRENGSTQTLLLVDFPPYDLSRSVYTPVN